MTDHDRAGGELGTLLRERVCDVNPDLGALTTSAIRAGRRIKNRRRLAVTSTTLSGVAAAAVLAVQLAPTPSGAPGEFAAAPSSNPSTPADPSQCLPPLQARVHSRATHLAVRNGTPRLTHMTGAVRMPKTHHQTTSPCPTQPADPQTFPVSLQAPGWTCDTPGDDKFTCTDGASRVLVTLRPARFHDDYLNNPDKASASQFVSDIHDGSFATIELVSGNVSIDQLAKYLTWT